MQSTPHYIQLHVCQDALLTIIQDSDINFKLGGVS